MANVDFSKLRQLPPDARVKALQRLEEELNKLISARQKEIEEAKKLLEDAKEELSIIEEIHTPEIKKVDVAKLFERKEIPEEQKAAELEEIAGEIPEKIPAEQESYANFMAQNMSVDQLQNRLYDIRQSQEKTGVETWYQQNFVGAAERAFELKREFGNYVSGSKKEATLTAGERLVQYLK